MCRDDIDLLSTKVHITYFQHEKKNPKYWYESEYILPSHSSGNCAKSGFFETCVTIYLQQKLQLPTWITVTLEVMFLR